MLLTLYFDEQHIGGCPLGFVPGTCVPSLLVNTFSCILPSILLTPPWSVAAAYFGTSQTIPNLIPFRIIYLLFHSGHSIVLSLYLVDNTVPATQTI